MLTVLIATGLLDGGFEYSFETPASRRASLTADSPRARFAQSLDPADTADYVADFAGLLADDETIASYTLAVAGAGSEWGVSVREDDGFAADLIDNDTAIRFYPAVAEEERDAARWRSFGRRVTIEATATTNATPARTFQRTLDLQVRQQ